MCVDMYALYIDMLLYVYIYCYEGVFIVGIVQIIIVNICMYMGVLSCFMCPILNTMNKFEPYNF